MAVSTLGASAPNSPPSQVGQLRMPQRLRSSTRALKLHVALPSGDDIASVHSTRRESEPRGVIVTLCTGEQWLASHILPAQARTMARALIEAAERVELSQRHDRIGSFGQALAQEGGAA